MNLSANLKAREPPLTRDLNVEGAVNMGNTEADPDIEVVSGSSSGNATPQAHEKVQFNEQTNYLPTSKVIAVSRNA